MPADSERALERAIRAVLRSWGIRRVSAAALSEALAAGDLDRVVALLGATTESLGPVLERLQAVYVAMGSKFIASLPRRVVGEVSFGLTNPRVMEYLRTKNLNLIQNLKNEQREIVRSVLVEVAERRANPRTAIRQLTGVKGPTGVRTGSVIGLSRPQFEYVTRAREELFSGDPKLLKNYLTRERRDRTLDHIVNKAIRDGRPLKAADVDRLTARYTDRLLDLRAETIARSEHHEAVEAARQAGMDHMIESGKIKTNNVKKVWDSTGKDGKTRPDHLDVDGQAVAVNEPFIMPDGSRMMYPGDKELGAGPHQTANCRCTVRYEIDYYAELD